MLESTVATKAPPRSLPSACIRAAHTAMIRSPSNSSPVSSTIKQRSASPSNATPKSKSPLRTRSLSCSKCVEPHPSLMFSPSGSRNRISQLHSTCRSSRPIVVEDAPFAQSTATRRPDKSPLIVLARWSVYSITGSSLCGSTRPSFSWLARGTLSKLSISPSICASSSSESL